MDELQVVAILELSDGNASVGEMWQETKVFPHDTMIGDVLRWAQTTKTRNKSAPIENFRGNLKLAIAQ